MSTQCRIELFGGLRVVQDDRVITRFRTHKAASLLAYLALNLRQTHARERLLDLFWPDMDLDAGRDNLSTALSSLRRQLEPTGVPSGTVLVANRQSVRLNPAAVTTDVADFEAALRAAERAETEEARCASLQRAVDLYTGELLPGFYDEWAVQEQTRLAERCVDALLAWAGSLEQTGRLEAALEAARRAVQIDPFRETAYLLLMRLYGARDRAASALETYQELDRRLRENLGVSPAAATRELADRLRRDPHALARPTESEKRSREEGRQGRREATTAPTPAPRTPEHRAPNLPLQWTRFFGREEELARLTEFLSPLHPITPSSLHSASPSPRLITLTGPGGTGKTRLAIEVARRVALAYEGRVWFVSLADLPDPSLIPFALANALKLPPAPGADPLEQVMQRLSDGPALLLLDNFEHLLREQPGKEGDGPGASGVDFVRLLLERVPGLVCLATSRLPLHLGGEQQFPVSSLPTPGQGVRGRRSGVGPFEHLNAPTPEHLMQFPSVALYADRAQIVRPDFAITANNAEAVAALCRHLEGMPLAIEMAASWAKLLPPAKMLDRLERQLDLLVSRRRDLSPRHQSLRATIEWSYDLLSPEQQGLFARLSVFRGGWTLEAAEAVAGVQVPNTEHRAPNTLDLLAQLQEHSLIVAEEDAEGEPRYRMLEPLREFAEEKLAESGEADVLRQAHLAHFLQLAEEARTRFCQPDAKEWLDRLEREHDNLRAALDYCQGVGAEESPTPDTRQPTPWSEVGLRLAAALQRFWNVRGYLREGQARCRALLAHPGAAERTRTRGNTLNGAGTLAYLQADYAAGRAFHEEALAIFRELGEPQGAASALHGLGNIAFAEHDYLAARAFYEESLALRMALGEKGSIGASSHSLGNVEMREGRYDAARAHFEKALAARQEIGDHLAAAYTLGGLGQLAQAQKDYATAHRCCAQALRTFQKMGVRWSMALCFNDLSRIAMAQGDMERAARLFGMATTVRESAHYPVPPAERAEHEERLREMRAALGSEAFDKAWAESCAMTLEAAIEYALGGVKEA